MRLLGKEGRVVPCRPRAYWLWRRAIPRGFRLRSRVTSFWAFSARSICRLCELCAFSPSSGTCS